MPLSQPQLQVFNYVDQVDLKEFDLVEQDDLREYSFSFGANAAEIRDNYVAEIDQAGFYFRTYQVIWKAFCELLFALDRSWEAPYGYGNGGIFKLFWEEHRAGDYYWYWAEDGDLEYGWALYTDIESVGGVTSLDEVTVALFKGKEVSRKDITMIFRGEGPETGGTEAQTLLQAAVGGVNAGGIDVSGTPIDIPLFPKWSDKIKEKFHRSTDKTMSGWDKSLDDWTTELQISLTA